MSIPLDDPPGGDAHALRLEATRMAGLHDDLDAMARVLRGLDGAGLEAPCTQDPGPVGGSLSGVTDRDRRQRLGAWGVPHPWFFT